MTRYRGGSGDPLEIGIDAVGRAVGQHGRRMQNPTLPEYKSTNFPTEPVQGQVVRDKLDLNALWIYGSDDQWHKAGGGGVDFIKLTGAGQLVHNPPIGYDDHGNYISTVKTNNPALWDYLYDSGNIVVIYPQQPGFYTAMYNANWGAPTGIYRKTSQISVEYFFGSGFTTAWVVDTTDVVELDQMGQAAGYLPQVGSVAGPASGVAAGQIILSLDHTNGAPVNFYSELIIMRYSVN